MSDRPNLSTGFVQTINNDYDIANPPPACVQIVSLKSTDSERGTRYQVILSDGQYAQQGMLATHLNPMVEEGEILKYTVVKLTRFTVNAANGKKLVVILDLEVVHQSEEKIGDPVQFDSEKPSSSSTTHPSSTSSSSSSSSSASRSNQSPSKPASFHIPASPQKSPQKLRQPPMFQPDNKIPDVIPIEGLNPYNPKWSIKARVTSKSEIREWDKNGSKGKLFSVDLVDDSSEIKATGFQDSVDKFYSLLEVGKIYVISRGSIRPAKKQYSSIKNDYEITFDMNTSITMAEDQASSIPEVSYSFVKIADLLSLPKNTVVDVIGIVKETTDATTMKSKTQRELTKRDVTLVDETNKTVKLTIWNNQALENIDASRYPVLAVKGVKVSDYGGCSLSAFQSSVLKIDPDIPEADTLRGWFDSIGSGSTFTTLSAGNTYANISDDPSQRKFIKSLEGELERAGDSIAPNGETCVIKGTITLIPHSNNPTTNQPRVLYYPACPENGQKMELTSQGWYSTKLDKYFPECEYRYILKMQILDSSGALWVSSFNETAETILKKPAREIHELLEQGLNDEVEQAFQDATFQNYVFRVRSKLETDNKTQEKSIRHQILSCKPISFVAESKHLLACIQSYNVY